MHHPEVVEIPLFPLPDAVLFPGQALPLHIFEPRYRDMTAAALSGDRLLAVGLLRPGYEATYFTRQAPVHPLVGIGRILHAQCLPDGRYNLLLQGSARARIENEVDGQTYRVARAETCPTTQDLDAAGRARVRTDLEHALSSPASGVCRKLFSQGLALLRDAVDLETCVNLLAGALPVAGEVRQRLLERDSLAARATLLHRTLFDLVAARGTDYLNRPPSGLN